MKRLRHPIRAIREPFGTAGLIVAMVALVAALGGTAFAAAKLNSTQKKEVEKIAKKYAGKPGANGANGSNGSAGAAGKDGTNGAPGSPGESVTITKLTGTQCEGQPGAEFTVGAQKAKACNGKPGTSGFTPTLPSGKTETGAWIAPSSSFPTSPVSVSFPIPLETGLLGGGPPEENCTAEGATECHAHLILNNGEEQLDEVTKVEHPTRCHGTVAEPTADPGNLCIYVLRLVGNLTSNGIFNTPNKISELEEGATGKAGAILPIGQNEGESYGTWAVTAP